MKYKAVCFDVDSTLYPPEFERKVETSMAFWHPIMGKRYSKGRTEFRKCQKDFKKYGLEDADFATREAAMISRSLGNRMSVEKARKYLDNRFYSRLAKHYAKLPYQNETVRLFKNLKDRGIKIGIMSDWPLWNKLELIGVKQYCDFVCDPDGMKFLKPDAHTFEYLLYNLNLDASEVLYVGDSYKKDVEGAVGVGMDAVLVNHEDNGNYPKALKVFKNWKDFSFWMEAN